MNNYYGSRLVLDHNYLKHHGILGQKWGIRRFQNPDGSLTEEGKKRYGVQTEKQANRLAKYQEWQYKNTEKHYARQRAHDEKLLTGYKKVRQKAYEKGNVKKVSRLDEKIKNINDNMRMYESISKQVLKDIGDITYSDMKQENIRRGEGIALGLAATAGSIAISPYTGGFFFFIVPDVEGAIRIDREEAAEAKLKKKKPVETIHVIR